MMNLILFLLPLLFQVNASPTPEPVLPSVFHDPSIPVIDSIDFDLLNITSLVKTHPRDAAIEKRSLKLNFVLCEITLDGRNQGNPQAFNKAGYIIITAGVPTNPTINGRNPVDVVIVSGNPLAFPVAGSLRYTSNRYLNPYVGGSTIIQYNPYDFAYVSSTATSVSVKVDPRTGPLNKYTAFNLKTGFPLESAYNVLSGSFTVNIAKNNVVTGKVGFIGYDYLRGGTAPYKAIIRGKVIQRGTGNF